MVFSLTRGLSKFKEISFHLRELVKLFCLKKKFRCPSARTAAQPVMADKSFLALNERKLKSSVYRIERKAGCGAVVENTIGENWNKSILFCKEEDVAGIACERTG